MFSSGSIVDTSPAKPPKPAASMANWFSSLRRQPKAKKTPIAKALQKSCVDLSTAAAGPVVLNGIGGGAASSKGSTSNVPATTTNESVLAQTTNMWTLNTGSAGGSASSSATSSLFSTSETIQVDRQKRVTPATAAAGATTGSTTTTTNTKVVQTTIITKQSHRVGLVFDEEGELMSKVDAFRNFANSLNNQLSGNALLLGGRMGGSVRMSRQHQHHNNNSDSDSCRSSSLGGSSNQLDEEIEFIDCDRSPTAAQSPPQPLPALTTLSLSPQAGVVKCEVSKQIKDELCEVVAEMEALDSQEDCKHSNKNKQMSIGRKKFNMDPKKGIEYLCENHLLQMDAQDIAHFLYKGEGLNKTAIGDYLGEKNDFNEQVLKAFVELHDFTNLILVQALRQFLWSFRLPGEAQKIDRMMECFAQRYCQLNPDIFTNTDTCYVLSFAIIMLNTSLHNPSVKDKPTLEQFISMNRGINNGGDLPRELLESLYESIRTEPFKIPQDDGNDLMHTFFNPDKEGWLWKQGGRYKSWKRRWFILNDNCLYYFEYTTDKEPRGIIPLENISVREIQDRNKPHCFELYACGGADIIKACKTDSEGKVVEGKHTVYRMSAATEEDKLEWIKCLTQSISHNPFYDILVQRKKKALAKS